MSVRSWSFWLAVTKLAWFYQKAKELERQKSPSKTVDTPTTDIGLTGKVDGKAGYKVSLQFLI